MSRQAMIGTGITVAMIGLLFLMLALAQHMREVNGAALILLPLGAVLLILGALALMMAPSEKRQ